MNILWRILIWWLRNLLERGKADACIRECRHSHVVWSKWAEENPDNEALEIAGEKEHHDKWIRQYDHVLRVLRHMP